MKIQINDILYITCFEIIKTQVKKEGTKVEDYRKTAHAHLHIIRMMTKTNKTAHFVINVCLVLLSVKLYYYKDFLVKNRFERLQGDLILFYFHAPMSLTSNNYYLFCYFFKIISLIIFWACVYF